MDFYKKIIRNRNLRFKILAALRFVPDDTMIRLQYKLKTGRKLNLKNPERYTEKLQWYKLYYRDPVMLQCADKYAVRKFIKSKGLESILNELYMKFDSPEDISFDALPEQFVMKLSNGSGTNLLCANKNNLDLEDVKKNFRLFYARNSAVASREWVYNADKKTVIVVEKFLEDPDQNGGIYDYKFICFGGIPQYVVCDVNRFSDHRRNIYDMDWNDLHVGSDCPCSDDAIPRPAKLEEMVEIAKILAADFPAVRVDLYLVQNQIYFGELTFFPWSGYVTFDPDRFDFEAGKRFILPEANNGQVKS